MEDRLALVFALLVIHNGVMETPRVIVGRLQCSFRSEWGANIVGIDRRIGNRPAFDSDLFPDSQTLRPASAGSRSHTHPPDGL